LRKVAKALAGRKACAKAKAIADAGDRRHLNAAARVVEGVLVDHA
jgi:hypothetical protein